MILRCVTKISDPQEVEREYKSGNGISQDEARMRFLGVAVTWPTYGSVFFEVKVSFLRDAISEIMCLSHSFAFLCRGHDRCGTEYVQVNLSAR